MKQIYYVIQTLMHGRHANVIKIISLGLGLMMSILLFSRVAYEQSFDTCFKENENLYQVWIRFSTKNETFDWQQMCIGKLAGGIFEAMPDKVESATTISTWLASDPLYNGEVMFDDRKIVADSLFFQTMGIEVTSGNPVQDLQQVDVIYLSDDLAKRMFDGENPIGKVISYNRQMPLTVRGTFADIPANSTRHFHAKRLEETLGQLFVGRRRQLAKLPPHQARDRHRGTEQASESRHPTEHPCQYRDEYGSRDTPHP